MATATQAVEQELRMDAQQVRSLSELGEPVVILDARSDKAYGESGSRIRGDRRISPESPTLDPSVRKDSLIVTYCT